MPSEGSIPAPVEAIQRAFSKQAGSYDELDRANPILTAWRQQVYAHVARFITSPHTLLELNAGTGIDALHFAESGHKVHATDISPGMVEQIERKIATHSLKGNLTCQLCSFEKLEDIKLTGFDFVFSNFGGLNCSEDLSRVTQQLPRLIKPGAFITWVVMPRVCLWELKWAFQGHPKKAFRRWNKNGTPAHIEGEVFKTYYYSLSNIRKAFGRNFRLLRVEGLGVVSPPPSGIDFRRQHPTFYRLLTSFDGLVRHTFPMNRWADHLIVTFQYTPR